MKVTNGIKGSYMNNKLLPIAILTYNRIEHLKQTVEALRKNTLAKKSEIFFFSDAPKKGDEKSVQRLRQYLHEVDGFKKVHIIEQKENNYIKNTVGSVEYILKQYGKGIFLEDDIVTAPGFLQFMNDAEKYYRNNKKVFSISGYTPPIKISNEYTKDYFSLRRFSGWGNVIWADKYFEMNPFTKEQFQKADKKEIAKYGLDLLMMMEKQVKGELNANDINIMFHQYKYDLYTIYPKKSLVQNIGHDGTGVHCGITDKFHHNELWHKTKEFIFDDVSANKEIIKANFDFRFSMNIFAKELIVNNLIEQINELKSDSFSIYGIGELTNLLLAKLYMLKCKKKVNFFIDSKAEFETIFFNGKNVISSEKSLELLEKNFVIVSWNAKETIKDKLLKLYKNKEIKLIVPNI